jgi:hypothetical protein
MKWTNWLLIIFFALATKLGAQPNDLLLRRAEQLAENQPAKAAALYDSLRREGWSSPSLLLAQGNAYLSANDLGRAVLAYERGLRLKPGQSDLTNNLRFAETQLETVLPDLPGFFLERWWTWTGSRLGTTPAYVLAIILWWAAVLIFGWWFFKRKSLTDRQRFLALPVAGLSLLLAVLFLLLGNGRFAELNRSDLAVLVAPEASLRVAPGPNATLEQKLSAGQRLRIVDAYQNQYFKVVLRDGKQGWLSAENLEVI